MGADIGFHLKLAVAALALEAAVGYPERLNRRVAHPVVWVGAVIDWLERRWNRLERGPTRRRAAGIAVMVIIVGACWIVGTALERAAGHGTWGLALLALVATVGLAQNSLWRHVAAVDRALGAPEIDAARVAVGQIVGRDAERLDRAGILTAALESLAESFNDGVVAPAFWLAAAGLPGLFAYKAINTADSMIGHHEERWRAFGWAAARIDDLVNLIPARIAGMLIIVAGGGGLTTMLRDAPKHASPNAGWPEAAMAGALGVSLGGPAAYDGVVHERAVFGGGAPPVRPDLRRGLRLYLRGCAILWLSLAAGALAWQRR